MTETLTTKVAVITMKNKVVHLTVANHTSAVQNLLTARKSTPSPFLVFLASSFSVARVAHCKNGQEKPFIYCPDQAEIEKNFTFLLRTVRVELLRPFRY